MAKNVFQPLRDLLPYYPGCIRVILIMVLSFALLLAGSFVLSDGMPRSYKEYDANYVNGKWVYTYQDKGQSSDGSKIAGGTIMILIAIPLVLAGIYYYYKMGCGYNRFYTNNLVKFEGGGAVRKARKARR